MIIELAATSDDTAVLVHGLSPAQHRALHGHGGDLRILSVPEPRRRDRAAPATAET